MKTIKMYSANDGMQEVEYVPADVAQGLYDQLSYIERLFHAHERGEEMPDDDDAMEWADRTRKALAAADGEAS